MPRLGVIGLFGFLVYEGTGFSRSQMARSVPKVESRETVVVSAEPVAVSVKACLAVSSFDRSRLSSWAGLDVVAFVEATAKSLHSAKTTEDQLKVIAAKFDHRAWAGAWSSGALIPYVNPRLRENLRVQTDLNHASLFLSRYSRLIENGKRQEAAAMRAFQWDAVATRDMAVQPMRVLAQSYQPHACSPIDERQFGCKRDETLYRVNTVVSPQITCRFSEKRDQYTIAYWVRVLKGPGGRLEARIAEVETNGQRLVKLTYEDLQSRKLLSVLSPNMTESLVEANLDQFRTPVLWRRWTTDGRRMDDHLPGAARLPSGESKFVRKMPKSLNRGIDEKSGRKLESVSTFGSKTIR